MTLFAAGLAAAGSFLATAHKVRTAPQVREKDRKLRQKVPHDATHLTRRGQLIDQAQKIGKWYVQGPLAAAASALLWRTGHRRAASALSIASAASGGAASLFDAIIFHRPPPPTHPNPDTPSFPSGHALQLAAVSLTAGYVLMRERIAPASVTMPLALAIPLASSGARLYQDRHWTSDIVGGWLAGIALAAWSAAAYEMVPERSLARLERGIAHQARRVAAGVGDAVGDTVEDGLWGAERGVRRGRRQVKRGARHVERVVSRTAERADVASAAVGEGARQGLLLGLAQAVLDRFGGALTGRDAESDEDEPMDLR